MADNEKKVDEAVAQVEDAVEQAGEKLQTAGAELGRKAVNLAEEARKEGAKGLQKAAEKLRAEARANDNDAEALKRADDVAAGLERAALYLKDNSVEEMEKQFKKTVKAQPYQALLVAFVVGAIFGLLMRR